MSNLITVYEFCITRIDSIKNSKSVIRYVIRLFSLYFVFIKLKNIKKKIGTYHIVPATHGVDRPQLGPHPVSLSWVRSSSKKCCVTCCPRVS